MFVRQYSENSENSGIYGKNGFETLYNSMEKLLTPKQASHVLGITTDTLRKWGDKHKIIVVKTLGGHRRCELPLPQGEGLPI